MRSPALEEAEHWIASRPRNAPQPTEDTQVFITLSRKVATRRRNVVTASLATVLCIVTALAAAALIAFYVADAQRTDALIAQSKFLARDARSATADGNPTLGALLALAAMPGNLSAPDRPFIKEAGFALEDALDNERERAFIASGYYVKAVAMSPDGSRIATGTDDKLARIWDGRTGKQLLALAHDNTVPLVAFSSDGNRLITASGSSGCLDCDGTSWHVWDANTGRDILKLVNQAKGFPVFLPGFQRVITAVKGSPIELRETTTGATIATLDQTDQAAAIFSRDGAKILISSRNSKPQLWDALGGTLLRELATGGSSIEGCCAFWRPCCAFSPDGSRLILTVGTNVEIFDVATGETMVKLTPSPETDPAEYSALSADNKRAIAIFGNSVYLWDATSGAAIATLEHDYPVISATFSPDGSRLLTVSQDKRLGMRNTAQGEEITVSGQVRIWDTAQGHEIISMRSTNPRHSAVFAPDSGQVLISLDDTYTQLLDSATGAQIARLEGTLHPSGDAAIMPDGTRPSGRTAFTPDGRLVVTAATNGAADVWDVKTGNLVATLHEQQSGPVRIASFSSDGRSLMTDSYSAVQVWTLDPSVVASLDAADVLRGHEGQVNSVVFSPDGSKLATASADKTVRVWDVRTGATLLTLRGHDADVMSVAFAPDGKHLLTASLDKTARLWDATTGAALTVFEGHDDAVNAASFSPDGKLIVTASADKTAKVWDVASGDVLLTFRGHTGPVMSTVFSPDGKNVLSASTTILIWDAQTGAVLKELTPLEAKSQSSTWSDVTDPKDAIAWNNWIKRWEAGTQLKESQKGGWHGSFAFYSPDGTQVVGALSEWMAEVWKVATALPIHILENSAATWDAQFSPDARYIVSGSADGAAWLWAVKVSEPNRILITKLTGHDSEVRSATFSPSGAQVATAAADGTVRIWNISHCQAAIDRAHEILPREMSNNERLKYFLSEKAASTATNIFAKVRPWLAFALPAAGDVCE